MTDPIVKTLKIVNEKGLHARASAKLVEVVEGFDARCKVSKRDMDASGDSIMGLLMLGAGIGCSIDIAAEGPDAQAAIDALLDLVDRKFDEGE